MFKKRWMVLCLTAVMLLVCGCGDGRSQALPQLVIGSEDYEPYNYTDADGDPAGLDVELAREACARIGYEPVFRQIDWNERDALLERGSVDCLWSCCSMDGLEDEYAWVGPYMRSRQLVAVQEDSPVFALSDLAGRSVAVRVGAKAEKVFLEHTESGVPSVENVYSLNSMDEVATALCNNYVDAIAGYGAAVREVLQNNGIAFRFLEEDLSHASLGVAFAKDSDPTVREKLAAALEEMRTDGTTKSILEEYGVDTDKALGSLGQIQDTGRAPT